MLYDLSEICLVVLKTNELTFKAYDKYMANDVALSCRCEYHGSKAT